MAKKADKINKDSNPQDSLVDALESIKSLLAKSDEKLAAARESIAIASNQTPLSKLDPNQSGQYEIPVLDDIVIPAEIESATEEVSNISEQISEKIAETLAAVSENSPTLDIAATQPAAKPDPQIMLDYLDNLQKKLDTILRDSLMKSIVSIEAGLKKTITSEINKIRKQIKKDFK